MLLNKNQKELIKKKKSSLYSHLMQSFLPLAFCSFKVAH